MDNLLRYFEPNPHKTPIEVLQHKRHGEIRPKRKIPKKSSEHMSKKKVEAVLNKTFGNFKNYFLLCQSSNLDEHLMEVSKEVKKQLLELMGKTKNLNFFTKIFKIQ